MSSVDRRIDVDLDTDENVAIAVVEERREVEIDELFDENGELVVVWNVVDPSPDPSAYPLSDFPEFRGYEPQGVKVVLHPRLVPKGQCRYL
ncbi:hypothetical protein C471_16022 [Halorubrum saccharovorum DSM 1137]|uniref:Uncharacterized protein n=1 Tax=Halorubrum saccharovorum DSM 1137 TaxID=1227484 RepID=M0DLE1_9EURY|nr:hypothetical protein [Halorubrum saccharovorum]ELZ36326.1 hypothetical protein C471_16022 [Halorubrum saccharovorum DSM 1137]